MSSASAPDSGRPAFPLSAIVGQAELVEALLINAVAPDVGGLLIRGQRGTAKTTAVRGLAPLLPPVSAAADQPPAFVFAPGDRAPDGPIADDAAVEQRPAPLVELPLGATLDRVVGSLDLARALDGAHGFEAGLLARAHQGILYVDEVNLLPDHLVDALLDAAATGVARVEREAVSVVHDARFMLVGTMNVEEGELRPQLLDRFGLGVDVRTTTDPQDRAEIVRRRLAYTQDPSRFADAHADREHALAERIAAARARLERVRLPERELLRITGACAKLGVDGVRGDIVSARAAQALAALDGADEVSEEHVRRAAALALAHRRRRDPLDGHAPDPAEVERALDGEDPDDTPPDRPARERAPAGANGSAPAGAPQQSTTAVPPEQAPAAKAPEQGARFSPDAPVRERRDAPEHAGFPLHALTLPGVGTGPLGRRARTRGPGAGAIDSRPAAEGATDIALVATLRARLLGTELLREHVRAGREAAFICLVLDASGSMGARRRAARVKGALLELLRDAYARRDRVAVLAFRDDAAHLLVKPGSPLERAAAALRELPTGGRTPLAAGLVAAERLVRTERLRHPGQRSIAIVITDGRVPDPRGHVPRAAAALGRAADAVHVLDIEDGHVRLGLAGAIATAAAGDVHRIQSTPTRRAA
jgi:magnesium chelatase subunit D